MKQAAEAPADAPPPAPMKSRPPTQPAAAMSNLSMDDDEFVDALDGGWGSPTGGWGGDDDLGLTSPVSGSATNTTAPPAADDDDFFSSWGSDSKPTPDTQKELSAKPSLEQRRREAKERREQRKKQNSAGASMKLKGTANKANKDGWDDWDF